MSLAAIVVALLALPVSAAAQQLDMTRLEATPVGALPPVALPMPASRDHNYWTLRLEGGRRADRTGEDLSAAAATIDLQWRGGSAFGFTGGYQVRDCGGELTSCDGHMLFGLRARMNMLTGGPTLAGMFGDYSANTTLGLEMGFGYSPNVVGSVDACTGDLGFPYNLAMLQRVRLVFFFEPRIVQDFGCSRSAAPLRRDFMLSTGFGVQQLFGRGFDAYVGFGKDFRSGTGYQLGLTLSYVRLP